MNRVIDAIRPAAAGIGKPVNSFVFKQPVLIGDVVSFFAEITKVGRTSITVAVEVYAQRDPGREITVKVTEASLTYVAVGQDRKPREIPAAEPKAPKVGVADHDDFGVGGAVEILIELFGILQGRLFGIGDLFLYASDVTHIVLRVRIQVAHERDLSQRFRLLAGVLRAGK